MYKRQEQDYLTGLLWPRYDNALLRSKTGDPVAASQLKRLQERLTLKRIVEIDPCLLYTSAQCGESIELA